MYSVVNKLFILIIAITLVACDNNKKEAEGLLNNAELAIELKNYQKAILLLDSIEKTYPKQVEVRRKAIHIRPKAIEGVTLNEIEKNDSNIAVLQAKYNEMKSSFKSVNDPQLVEPYIIAGKSDKSLFETTGVQARITTNGDFYIVTSLVGNPVKHTSVSLLCKGNEVTTSVANYDGERNYRSGNAETITFIKSECDTLGKFAMDNEGSPMTLRFNGERTHNVKLSKDDVHTFADTYRYAMIISDLKSALRRSDYLNQQLSLARDQIARTLDENTIE